MSEIKKEKQKHSNIYEALSAFQGELKPIDKSSKVQFSTNAGKKVDFSYTPLEKIMETILPILSEHGLSIRHEIVRGGLSGSKEGVEAILTHETYSEEYKKSMVKKTNTDLTQEEREEWIKVTSNEIRSGAIYITQGGSDMKDTGSAITYARRYSLTMVLGISSEEDKDVELFEDRAKAAFGFAYTKAKSGIENAKNETDLEKTLKVIKDDLKKVEQGKVGALGLTKEQYEEMIKIAEIKKESFIKIEKE